MTELCGYIAFAGTFTLTTSTNTGGVTTHTLPCACAFLRVLGAPEPQGALGPQEPQGDLGPQEPQGALGPQKPKGAWGPKA
jgi:hypothetical protein